MSAQLYDETLLRTSDMPWIKFSDGIDYKILRTSAESGVWTVLFRCAKGSSFSRHVHYGAGEYFILKGVMDYRMGVAKAGDYGYEPLGVTHDHTAFVEDTELYFTNYGPIVFTNDDGSAQFILDWKFFADQQAEAQKEAASRRAA
jgi:anti-sigma factor ChrR (cupin superfamily)